MSFLTNVDRRRWLTAYAPLVSWAIVIFGFSSEHASAAQTSRFIRPLLEFLFSSASPETLDLIHAGIRKLAHLTEYGILGFLAFRAFRRSHLAILARYAAVACLVLSALVASADEFHQSFEASRTSSPMDVALDVFGSCVGLTLAYLWFRD